MKNDIRNDYRVLFPKMIQVSLGQCEQSECKDDKSD